MKDNCIELFRCMNICFMIKDCLRYGYLLKKINRIDITRSNKRKVLKASWVIGPLVFVMFLINCNVRHCTFLLGNEKNEHSLSS